MTIEVVDLDFIPCALTQINVESSTSKDALQ